MEAEVARELVRQRQPAFYALQPFKREAAEQAGAELAAARFAELVGYDAGWSVATLRLAGLRDFARSNALEYEVIAPAREVRMLPPPVFGGDDLEARSMQTREFFWCRLEDAVVSCKSSLILVPEQGVALLDYQDDELALLPIDLDVDPVVFGPTAEHVTALIGAGAMSGPPLDRALALNGLHSFNFGHWLLEHLPKLLACLDRPGFPSVPIIVDAQMPPQHREALSLIVSSAHPVLSLEPGEAVRVRELWTCSTILYCEVGVRPGEPSLDEVGPIDGDAYARLASRLQPVLATFDGRPASKRIYLSRKDSQHKRLVNRVEVEKWFSSQGFEIYDPGSLTFAEQLMRVRGADVVVGPEGSGAWLALWGRRGTAIGVLDNPYVDQYWQIAELCRGLGHRLSMLVGDVVREEKSYVKFSDYEIDVEALPAFLEGLDDAS